ncbi:hypothetical protein [Hyphococcus sp.]|uniref:gliding motility protein GldB-related protein n=1 Tax=Hyphococcus sp. TaxID=2038636 RepID=UPI002082F55C|nr:MAG: hypothetical protein DHS20C04_17640 [Marinicaulis sp.]
MKKTLMLAAASLTLAAACDRIGVASPEAESNAISADVPADSWLADFAAAQRLDELGGGAEDAERFAEAGAYYELALNASENVPSSTSLVYGLSAAFDYAKAGSKADALRVLERIADKGWRQADLFEAATDFEMLRDDDRFVSAMQKMRDNEKAFYNSHRDPAEAKLIFDDVARFWAAYDLLAAEKNKAKKAAILRKHYLAPGTPGLIDYHRIKTQTMEQLVTRLEDSPGYYEGIRERTLSASAYGDQIRDGLNRFVAMYPEASVPDVTFVIGRLNSGGTAGPTGMLIGLDVWSWAQGVPLDGVSEGFQKVVKNLSLDSLPFIVVHEHVHALQQYSGEQTVLLAALQEGSADFLAGLALPENEKPHYYNWGLEREEMIWRRFQDEMDTKNIGNWSGNNGSIEGGDWYADLGYFVGARICEAYYEQAADKAQAIRDLMFVSDPKAILEASGYAARFEG